jgi:hypothetical protein
MSHPPGRESAPRRTLLIALAALALVSSLALLPRLSTASSSSPPGTDKFFIENYPQCCYAKFAELNYTMQGGSATACVAASSKLHVGDTLTIDLRRKDNNQRVLLASLTLTESQTTVVLGQVDGTTYKARIFFAKDSPVCSATWPEQHDLWYLTISTD